MFKNMSKRRIVLLSIIGVLAVIFVIQQIMLNISPVKKITLKENPDTITISGESFTTVIYRDDDDNYFVGEKKYKAADYIAEDLFETIKKITILSKLTSSTSESDNERYGFEPGNEITVTGSKDGKILRTVKIGKKASTGNQTYVRLDDSSDTLLASSRLRDMYNLKTEAVRSKEIFMIDSSEISSVTILKDGKKFIAERNQNGLWTGGKDTDSAKVSKWIESIKDLDAEKWASDETVVENAVNLVTIVCKDKTVTIELIPGEKKEDDWLCKSSVSPYCFYISEAAAGRLLKDISKLK